MQQQTSTGSISPAACRDAPVLACDEGETERRLDMLNMKVEVLKIFERIAFMAIGLLLTLFVMRTIYEGNGIDFVRGENPF
ncbi:hypothetical protein MO973_12800 [Paenibacillus sp. TRM 82003]|nr:hypothetical protein [Paenibacillus sp. TRM 82003]